MNARPGASNGSPHMDGALSSSLPARARDQVAPYDLLLPHSEGFENRFNYIRELWDARVGLARAGEVVEFLHALSIIVDRPAASDPHNRRSEARVHRLANELLKELEPHLASLTLEQLGDIALSCKAMSSPEMQLGKRDFVAKLADAAATRECLDQDSVDGLSRITHLLILREQYSPTLFEALEHRVLTNKLVECPQSYANFLLAFAELDPARQQAMATLVRAIADSKVKLDCASRQRVAKGITRLDYSSPSTAAILLSPTKPEASARGPSDQILSWFARNGYPQVETASRKALAILREADPKSLRELATIVRPFVRWGVDSEVRLRVAGLVRKISVSGSDRESPSVKLGDLALIMKLLGEGGKQHAAVLGDLARMAREHQGQFSLEDAESMLRAMHFARLRDEPLFERLCDKLAAGIQHLNPQQLPGLYLCVVALNFKHIPLLEGMHQHFQASFISGESAELRELLPKLCWSAVKLSSSDIAYTGELFRAVARKFDQMSPSDRVKCAWAASALGSEISGELTSRMLMYYERTHGHDLTEIDTNQLYQAAVANRFEVPALLAVAVERAPTIRAPGVDRNGRFERQMEDVLAALGVPFKREYRIAGYDLDFLVDIEGKQIAIECDGSLYHRVGGDELGDLRANNKMRDSVLARFGIPTIRVVDKNWDPMLLEQRMELIKRELEGVLASKAADLG